MLPRLVSVGRFAGAGRPLNNKGELGKQDTEARASALGLTLTLGKRGQNSHPAMSELWHGAVAADRPDNLFHPVDGSGELITYAS